MTDNFRFGKPYYMDDFDYDLACLVFGRPLVDQAWRRPASEAFGRYRVVHVDRHAGTVTVTFKAE